MNRGAWPAIRLHTVVEALLLCLFAGLVGLAINFQTIYHAFSGQLVVSSNTTEQAAESLPASGVVSENHDPFPVGLDEIDDLLAEGALLIDARNSEAYKAGHLVSAISMPVGQVESMLNDFTAKVSIDRTLIIYCSGYGCPDSHKVAVVLIQKGYSDVLVYEGGYPEWRDAGRPTTGGGQ